MTNYNESPDDKLTEILRELDRGEYLGKGGVPGAKQAILNWHNKQVEEVLDRLECQVTIYKAVTHNEFGVPRTIVVAHAVPESAIEAERNKLKEMLHG